MSLKLKIGALGPSIAQQAATQGYTTRMPAERLDVLEHSIHLLRISGLLTHTESDRALKRLIKDMGAAPREALEPQGGKK